VLAFRLGLLLLARLRSFCGVLLFLSFCCFSCLLLLGLALAACFRGCRLLLLFCCLLGRCSRRLFRSWLRGYRRTMFAFFTLRRRCRTSLRWSFSGRSSSARGGILARSEWF